MMQVVNKNTNNGIGFVGLLTILFVGLKLTNFIDWSWWWVLAPIWGVAALIAAIIAVCAVIAVALK